MTSKQSVKGTVEAVYENSVNTRNGPTTTYALRVDGQRYSAGFKALGCSEGDIVEFIIAEKNGYWNVDGGVTVVGAAVKAETLSAVKAGPKKAVNWEEKDRRITYLACRNAAIEFVKMMIDVNALEVKGKDREGLILGYVQKYSDEFFLESWVDEGYKNLTSIQTPSEDVKTDKKEEE